MHIDELPTPAVVIDLDLLDANLATMSAALPGSRLRPHVKAHKSTALARRQYDHGHHGFTCATPREVLGMARVGLGDDLLLANEVVDPHRLRAMAEAQDTARITIAVDSEETVVAAAKAGLQEVLVDVDIGLPRCGCRPGDAGRIAELARSRGLSVRGVMGYEGHLMMVDDPERKRTEVDSAVDTLLRAHADVGGDVVSSGGTGTYHLHDRVTEVQAGSYALMDTAYSTLATPFQQALSIAGTVISVAPQWAVCDVGLKALGMDHGDPRIEGAAVWFCSDEHTTFASERGVEVGDRVRVLPAHVDPTMAMHDTAWVVRTDSVVDRWEIDLRGW